MNVLLLSSTCSAGARPGPPGGGPRQPPATGWWDRPHHPVDQRRAGAVAGSSG